MDLKISSPDKGIVVIETIGNISRENWGPDDDKLSDLAGLDVYTRKASINLSRSGHIDSTGVEWLLASHNQFETHGGQMVIHSAKPMVSQLLKIMRMNFVLNIASDREQAQQLLNERPSSSDESNP